MRGAVPVRIWERSSSQVTSRTQWLELSIVHWPRTRAKIWAGEACCGLWLVMMATRSVRTLSFEISVVMRSMCATWPQYGNVVESLSAVEVQMRRVSCRPWAFSTV